MNDTAWFAPKRFGYGAGLPIVWQGWAMLVVHVVAISGAVHLLAARPVSMIVAALLIALLPLPLPLYAAKTGGGWRWRSGRA